MIIHISFAKFYRFEGWVFEWDRGKPFGPWPCKADLEPRKRAGKKFYDVFGRFSDLTVQQQEACRIKEPPCNE